VEKLWDKGIIVTIAAGNGGPKPQSVTSPGVSRRVITVGTSDDGEANDIDRKANFSGRGPTSECVVKPDIVAPGTNVLSCLSDTPAAIEHQSKKKRIVDGKYLCLSGTSMSTPVVAGAVACLLEKYPNLTPDEVKYHLKTTAMPLNRPTNVVGWGQLDLVRLLKEEPIRI
jgi:serine protease AprX